MKEKDRIIKFESWIKQFCKTPYELECFENWQKEKEIIIKKETLGDLYGNGWLSIGAYDLEMKKLEDKEV